MTIINSEPALKTTNYAVFISLSPVEDARLELNLALIKNPPHLFEHLDPIVKQHLKGGEAEAFTAFVRVYLESFPLQEWQGRALEDLYGFCYGVWHQFKTAPQAGPQIKIFNPTIEEHGWICGRSVITVLQKDMSFLVDSIRIELNQRDIPIHAIKSTVMQVDRNNTWPQVTLTTGREPLTEQPGVSKEAFIYLEIALNTDERQLARLKTSLIGVLNDVSRVVQGYVPILAKLKEVTINLMRLGGRQDEVVDFLNWLPDSHFTFLGYREYDFVEIDGKKGLLENAEQRLGIFLKLDQQVTPIFENEFSLGMEAFHKDENSAVCFSKSATRSNVHRAVYPDYIVVKKYDDAGRVTGEIRFLGLYTYAVYTIPSWRIPILQTKVEAIVQRSGIDPHSHDGKYLARIIESFPRDEMFQTDTNTLFDNIMSIASINERHVVRLIMRRDPFGSFVNCLVYVPRDNFNTKTRIKIEQLIGRALNSDQLDSITHYSESTLARLQLVFKVDPSVEVLFDVGELEASIVDVTRTWDDNLRNMLVEFHGESRGISQFHQYQNAFSPSYQEHFDARTAVKDIEHLERLNNDNIIEMNFYQPVGSSPGNMRFKVMHLHSALELSDVVPILENLGLRVQGEHPYQITKKSGDIVWLHDFTLQLGPDITLDVHSVRGLFQEAFESVWRGKVESDAFNRLVLRARLSWREVALLRTYAGYMRQTGFNSEQSFIADTLVTYTDITRNIIALFRAGFDPRLHKSEEVDTSRFERLKQKIIDGLEAVNNLNEDRVLRRYLELISGTLRTNYFQKQEASEKSYISIKLNPRAIPDIPEPRPMFEIYVYSPRVEGVHLRGGKVARGGLRWSDRLQDYRTEVLGLVKAQQVKNSVIVPTGAKGGFVCKKPPQEGGREAYLKEGIACYRLFIQGLLDVTDNLQQGAIIPPENVIRKDEDDPYLVVAADKGTATFSDIANDISLEYNHWLGDAFASGGSQGYDHKGMGITARGAWVSVQRHFREQGLNIQQQDFSVVGIGDMAGDVFGNGMLLSEHICLVAAFNHMHIFVDPNPDAGKSFVERQRLFQTPRTTWADYDKSLIAKGGGVFLRSSKYIEISAEMKERFGIAAARLTPNEFISALLKAPVDLIWNGGIGTYVKASWETHGDVGDKSNDGLRVNGRDLRCKVFGEGGNLGMTQLGRVEFCLNGGACNTDFIDNAGGVDCSDHEVNIKILLDDLIRNGDLTDKQRNQLLASMTETVAELVLDNNYRQTQAISVAEFDGPRRITEYRRFIQYLENLGRLDRALEYLPTDDQLMERVATGKSLTRPELSVLISYAKMTLKEALANTDLADDHYVVNEITKAFPAQLFEKYEKEMYSHRLRKELVATQVANDMVNTMGITATNRLLETTGASYAEIAKAYIVSRDVFQVQDFMSYIESLDYQLDARFQYELISNMVRRVRRGTRWFLRNRRSGLDPKAEVESFRAGLAQLNASIAAAIEGSAREKWLSDTQRYQEQSIPESWALKLAMPSNLFSGLGIVEAAHDAGSDVAQIADVYFEVLDKLNLNWFATQLSEVKVESHWQAVARESYIDDLEAQLRRLTVSLMRLKGDMETQALIDLWLLKNTNLVERWGKMVNQVQSAQVTDYAMFAVALRELIDLAQATLHCQSLQDS